MPFLDDSGPRPEQERGLLWRSIALIGEQLERIVLLNILWALQLVPFLAAWAFPSLPFWLRTLFMLYSAFAFIPATATLFAVLDQVNEGLPLDVEMIKAGFRAQFVPSLTKLLPLYSLFYWLALLSVFAAQNEILFLDAVTRLLILLLAVFSVYWGGALVSEPHLSAPKIFTASMRLFWLKPGPTLLGALLCLIALALGLISIGGIFLIVPVLIVLIQIQLYRSVKPH